MDSILEYNLQEKMFSDNTEYFFTFLTCRFDYLNNLWIQALEKKFGKKFQPIWILLAKENEFFQKKNYIVVNRKLKEIKSQIKKDDVIYLQEYEDLNKEFSESGFIKDLIGKLVSKQGRVFILDFTSSCLNIENPKAIIIGPKPEIATQFDNKVEHIKLFEKLKIPRNNTRLYVSIEEIKNKEKFPFYISSSFTSGGHESSIVYTEQDLDVFYSNLRDLNKKSHLLVADLITDIVLSPNVNAIAYGENQTEIICITDQIVRGHQYLGNIYPSKSDKKEKETIIKATKTIGNYLSTLGYRGLFGLDFIIDSKGNVITVDLNPRRQGGYLCNVLMSKVNIVELELSLALGEKPEAFSFDDFQADYCWAHSKIKPYYKNVKIKDCYKWGDYSLPFIQKGSMFKAIFYPKDSLLIDGNAGYFVVSGDTYEEVKKRVIKETEIILSVDFELYLGGGLS